MIGRGRVITREGRIYLRVSQYSDGKIVFRCMITCTALLT